MWGGDAGSGVYLPECGEEMQAQECIYLSVGRRCRLRSVFTCVWAGDAGSGVYLPECGEEMQAQECIYLSVRRRCRLRSVFT